MILSSITDDSYVDTREKIQINTTQVSTARLEGGTNPHVFTNITMFTYTVPVWCNGQILNDSKPPAKGFGLVMIKISKRHHYKTLAIIIYATKSTKTISQTAVKSYNKL